MPNVTRGQDLPGLVGYLFGPGRANEHTDPRMIASHAGLAAEGAPHFTQDGQLSALSRELTAPKTLFGTGVKDGYVWHCSISLPPEDGELSDEQWATVAGRMVDAMGFSSTSGKAPCRWIAVHHGKSTGGNDHIHVAVNLVREDGTKANVWRDRPRSQQICGELETELGLRIVEGRRGQSVPGIKRGERESATRQGLPEPARRTLARRVRAAAGGANSEADFVQRLRCSGVLARPRFGTGDRRSVVGYSVALRSEDRSMPPTWFGGGKLAGDLTLSALRMQWPDSDPAEAVSAWTERGSGPDRVMNSPWMRDESAWEIAAQQVTDWRERLADVPPGDSVRWSQTAREAAAVFSAWSARIEPNRPGPLAHAADVLARSAQLPHGQRHQQPGNPGELRGVILVVNHSRNGALARIGEALLLQSLRNTMRAIHGMHQARHDRDQAREIEASARGDLARLQSARQQLQDSPGALPQPGPIYTDPSFERGPEGPQHGR
ncbi:hypothetical protein QMK19_28960 [Streptomyces sp. H10-C2]|uniref:relaxase/mobilization nuclease domain-containing protein n=1 Tax=Streptomyces TaxID=1883 RepID=UPI0018E002D8|nr:MULTISPECIES: hypothetical protein [Streptomyces]MDJ0344241.1 hypothetical protein [Streptomyces sp. PH10-H1]MDJ0373579.1 hypothetical protein [Streptomyces sp. H10-C2]